MDVSVVTVKPYARGLLLLDAEVVTCCNTKTPLSTEEPLR